MSYTSYKIQNDRNDRAVIGAVLDQTVARKQSLKQSAQLCVWGGFCLTLTNYIMLDRKEGSQTFLDSDLILLTGLVHHTTAHQHQETYVKTCISY